MSDRADLVWASTVSLDVAGLTPGQEERLRRVLVAAVRRGYRAGTEAVVTLVSPQERPRVRAEVRALLGDQSPAQGMRRRTPPEPW